jgi:L-asparaginase
MDRVCVIYTGGTIGMRKVDSPRGPVLVPPESGDTFLEIAPELRTFVHVELLQLLNKDSTNMNPGDWHQIATAIYERRDAGFKGIIVAHGTDTMHFSSSAVAFALGHNLNFPVVFTGAQTDPSVPGGDARRNLVNACRVALTDLAEVVISFGDYVFRACRAQKKDEKKFDAFESPAYFPIAYITETIDLQPIAYTRQLKPPTGIHVSDFTPDFESGVLQVELIPGLEPELMWPTLDSPLCRGIILKSFGAGNVPNDDVYSFIPFIEEAVSRRIPVIITSQFPANSTLDTKYKPGVDAVEAGAIPTGNMTSAAATTKFRWVLGQVNRLKPAPVERMSVIRQMMSKVYIGEMTIGTDQLDRPPEIWLANGESIER